LHPVAEILDRSFDGFLAVAVQGGVEKLETASESVNGTIKLHLTRGHTMIGTTGEGWLLSLGNKVDWAWNCVESFYEDMEQSIEEAKNLPDGRVVIEISVEGRLRSSYGQPCAGDGIGFYHSTRAAFPTDDKFKRKARLSAIGEMVEVISDRPDFHWFDVALDPVQFRLLKANPVIRDEIRAPVFEHCRIVQGSVATMYKANARAWSELVALLPSKPSQVSRSGRKSKRRGPQ
jgi:hypothetical protein